MTRETLLRVASKKRMAGRSILRRTCAQLVLIRVIPENEIPPAMRVDIYLFKHPPQCHRYSFLIMLLIVLSCIDFNFTFVYNIFYEVYVMKKLLSVIYWM